MSNHHRVGLIVPSSNTTMETEIPTMLRRYRSGAADDFTFHSSRMPMRRVSPEELARMDAESARCARELSDARCDVLAYACLVAIMATGLNYHVASEQHLSRVAAENGGPAP
ncbi:MAG: Asp/Glu racemase, partial [Chloroflexi bacterium]|nr:Asp/Glu racemase [Chloroflexota bacterium]